MPKIGLLVISGFCLVLNGCWPSAKKTSEGELRESVALNISSDQIESESNRLAGTYSLMPTGLLDDRWCDLFLEPADGDVFIGFQSLWFGPGCQLRFPMLAHTKGWGPGADGITLYGVNDDTLEHVDLKFVRTTDGDF